MLMWQADSQCDKKIIFCFDQPYQYFPHFPSITFHPLFTIHYLIHNTKMSHIA